MKIRLVPKTMRLLVVVFETWLFVAPTIVFHARRHVRTGSHVPWPEAALAAVVVLVWMFLVTGVVSFGTQWVQRRKMRKSGAP